MNIHFILVFIYVFFYVKLFFNGAKSIESQHTKMNVRGFYDYYLLLNNLKWTKFRSWNKKKIMDMRTTDQPRCFNVLTVGSSSCSWPHAWSQRSKSRKTCCQRKTSKRYGFFLLELCLLYHFSLRFSTLSRVPCRIIRFLCFDPCVWTVNSRSLKITPFRKRQG